MGAITTTSPPPSRLRRGRRLALFVVVLTALVRLPSFFNQLYITDEASIAAQAIAMREGGTLYEDVADRKPPLVQYLYEWSFELTDSVDMRPLHGLVAIGTVLAALALATDQRRRHAGQPWAEAAAWWAAGLFVVGVSAFPPADGMAANYANFAVIAAAFALVLLRRATAAGAAAGGAALGIAILCRQSWIAAIPAAAGGAALQTEGRRRWLHAGWALVGTGLTVAAAGLFVPFSAFWRWTFSGNEGFLFSPSGIAESVLRGLASTAIFLGFHLALVGLVVVRARRSDRLEDADLWSWLATGLVSVVLGLRFSGHYWLQVIPPAVLLAAPVAARAGRQWVRALLGLSAAAAMVAFALGWFPNVSRDLYAPDDLVAYVEANSGPGDPVMVWGNFPALYWSAERVPGGGLVHTNFVTGLSPGRDPGRDTLDDATPGALDLLLEELAEDPPLLVLDTSTAGLGGYEHYPLSAFPALAAVIAADYEVVDVVENVTIYRRRGG